MRRADADRFARWRQEQELKPPKPELPEEVWEREHDISFKTFVALLPDLLAQGHRYKYAVMHGGELVEIVDSKVTAVEKAHELFLSAGKPYTIMLVLETTCI